MRQEKLRNHLNHPYPRAERKFRKGASLFSGFLKPEGPPTNAAFKNPAFACGDLPIGCAQKTVPFDAPFAADGDMATVTWSNLPERLKGRKRG
ncbi:hypothetical protein B5G27_11055, partial [Lachnoclostridium sp. An76]